MTKSRREAFSDGMIAIIITIMVLELKVPREASLNRAGSGSAGFPQLRVRGTLPHGRVSAPIGAGYWPDFFAKYPGR